MRKRQLKSDAGGIGGVTRTLIDRHSGQGTISGVFNLDFDSYERYLDFETGVLHRILSRNYLAAWLGLGSHFEKICLFGHNFKQIPRPVVFERVPNIVSSLNVTRSRLVYY